MIDKMKCTECGEAGERFDEVGISIRLGDTATEIVGDGTCHSCVMGAIYDTLGIANPVDEFPTVSTLRAEMHHGV